MNEHFALPRKFDGCPLWSYQKNVAAWMQACFGPEIAADKVERNHRFCEEALELVQACGCTASEAHQLVDYVFNRPVGEKAQEVGGVMTTLAALCEANGIDLESSTEAELARVWSIKDKIRAKQAAKPKFSALAARPTVGSLTRQIRVVEDEVAAAGLTGPAGEAWISAYLDGLSTLREYLGEGRYDYLLDPEAAPPDPPAQTTEEKLSKAINLLITVKSYNVPSQVVAEIEAFIGMQEPSHGHTGLNNADVLARQIFATAATVDDVFNGKASPQWITTLSQDLYTLGERINEGQYADLIDPPPKEVK